jgi:hypothetical protein
MTFDAVSAEGIKAQMPHPILTRVFGKPTHKQIKTIIRELLANLMAISCPWGHSKGHLGLLQDPAIYLACNGEAFNMPHVEPPAYPVIPAGAMTADRNRNYVPPLLPLARHGTPTRWSSPSHTTNSRQRLPMSTMPFLTTPPKISTPSLSAP